MDCPKRPSTELAWLVSDRQRDGTGSRQNTTSYLRAQGDKLSTTTSRLGRTSYLDCLKLAYPRIEQFTMCSSCSSGKCGECGVNWKTFFLCKCNIYITKKIDSLITAFLVSYSNCLSVIHKIMAALLLASAALSLKAISPFIGDII